MFFSRIAIVVAAFAAASGVVSARPAPARLTQRDVNCGVKDIHCCDQVMSGKDAGDALGGLLALPESLIGNVGLGCSPIGLANLGSCAKSTPVCCSKVYQDGLINIGCTPLSAF